MTDRLIIKRNRIKHERSFEERLLDAAREAREAARRLPPGKKRETLLRSARDTEAAAGINKWISLARAGVAGIA